MPSYNFRINFRLSGGDSINHDSPDLEILAVGDGPGLMLKGLGVKPEIKDVKELLLIGGPFPTATEAAEAGQRALAALYVFSLQSRVGLDLGHVKEGGGGPSDYAKQSLKEKLGLSALGNVPGLSIYEAGSTVFVGFDALLSRGHAKNRFVEQIAGVYPEPPNLSDRQTLAIEIYMASHFEESPRTRFVTLVIAVEALMTPAPRTREGRQLVDHLQELVKKSALSEEEIESLLGSLEYLKEESKGKTGRALAKKLLGDKTYGGKKAEDFFKHCYPIRSQIVHTGKPKDPQLNLRELAGQAEEFVADLLKASIGLPLA